VVGVEGCGGEDVEAVPGVEGVAARARVGTDVGCDGASRLVTGGRLGVERVEAGRLTVEIVELPVDDLDKRIVETSEVDTREMDGVARSAEGSSCNNSRRRCADRMLSCIAAILSCRVWISS
jgi:hypothetical protein